MDVADAPCAKTATSAAAPRSTTHRDATGITGATGAAGAYGAVVTTVEVGLEPVAPNDLACILTDPSTPLVLVDVRDSSAFRRGHISGAISLPCSADAARRLASGDISPLDLADGASRMSVQDKCCSAEYLVLCDSDSAGAVLLPGSPLAACIDAFRRMGFKNITFLRGGVSAFVRVCPSMIKRSEAASRPPPLRLGGTAKRRAGPAPLTITKLSPDSRTPSPGTRMSVDANVCSADSSPQPPSQVVPGIFIGNSSDAANRSLLYSLGIRYVLNITDDLDNFLESDPEFRVLRVPLRDTWHQDVLACFKPAFAFLREAEAAGAGVLVHCRAGISRSPTIVIAYLMSSRGLNLFDAFTSVKAARPRISPNLDFMGQLLQFEASLGMESSSLALLLGDQQARLAP